MATTKTARPAGAAKKQKGSPTKKPASRKSSTSASTPKTKKKAAPKAGAVKLLSGGNPQIAKADGDAPVQAYIAAVPGWRSAVCKRLDEIVVRAVPRAQKAVRWNSPMYGVAGQGYFASMHVFTKYVKLTFFKGTQLSPLPPGGTEKSGEGRWIDLYEADALDEAQLTSWMKQAAAIPGWDPSAK